jgi:hypothetical protein
MFIKIFKNNYIMGLIELSGFIFFVVAAYNNYLEIQKNNLIIAELKKNNESNILKS